jgi:hypothetical protein
MPSADVSTGTQGWHAFCSPCTCKHGEQQHEGNATICAYPFTQFLVYLGRDYNANGNDSKAEAQEH